MVDASSSSTVPVVRSFSSTTAEQPKKTTSSSGSSTGVKTSEKSSKLHPLIKTPTLLVCERDPLLLAQKSEGKMPTTADRPSSEQVSERPSQSVKSFLKSDPLLASSKEKVKEESMSSAQKVLEGHLPILNDRSDGGGSSSSSRRCHAHEVRRTVHDDYTEDTILHLTSVFPWSTRTLFLYFGFVSLLAYNVILLFNPFLCAHVFTDDKLTFLFGFICGGSMILGNVLAVCLDLLAKNRLGKKAAARERSMGIFGNHHANPQDGGVNAIWNAGANTANAGGRSDKILSQSGSKQLISSAILSTADCKQSPDTGTDGTHSHSSEYTTESQKTAEETSMILGGPREVEMKELIEGAGATPLNAKRNTASNHDGKGNGYATNQSMTGRQIIPNLGIQNMPEEPKGFTDFITCFEFRWFIGIYGQMLCLVPALCLTIIFKLEFATIVVIAFVVFFGAIYQCLVFGLAGTLDCPEVLVALSTGQGLSGIITGFLALVPISRSLIFIYLAMTALVVFLTANLYWVMKRHNHLSIATAEFFFKKPDTIETAVLLDTVSSDNTTTSSTRTDLEGGTIQEGEEDEQMNFWKETWPAVGFMLLGMLLNYVITFTVFPGAMLLFYPGNAFMGTILIGVFQICDVIGRKAPDFSWIVISTGGVYAVLLGRLLFIPIFFIVALCGGDQRWLANPEHPLIGHLVKITSVILFALTNGYISTIVYVKMMEVLKKKMEKSFVGQLTSFFIVIGIMIGGVIAYGCRNFLPQEVA